MTDLVERLRDLHRRFGHLVDLEISNGWAEAATALEAKDKELAALREHIKSMQHCIYNETKQTIDLEGRLETAERERDEVRAALNDANARAMG